MSTNAVNVGEHYNPNSDLYCKNGHTVGVKCDRCSHLVAEKLYEPHAGFCDFCQGKVQCPYCENWIEEGVSWCTTDGCNHGSKKCNICKEDDVNIGDKTCPHCKHSDMFVK